MCLPSFKVCCHVRMFGDIPCSVPVASVSGTLAGFANPPRMVSTRKVPHPKADEMPRKDPKAGNIVDSEHALSYDDSS